MTVSHYHRTLGAGAATKPPDIPRLTRNRNDFCSCSTLWAVKPSSKVLSLIFFPTLSSGKEKEDFRVLQVLSLL